MEEIQYIGEHLLPGKFGHMAIIMTFVSGLLACVAYYFATQRRDQPEYLSWRNIGRMAFGVHGVGVFVIIGTIFYIMTQQYYEYQYVQAHVSEDLPFKYIFSAFWEGQEGSFLLWMFWHVILGFVLMAKAGKWETPVLSVLASIQVIIVSMILGLYIGWGEEPIRIGSNPLLLLRDVVDAPIFSSPDYVGLIKGNGLNPLLQNYWMTIHPPTLFLGFASTAIPFCYAIAGLWTKEHKAWLTPALPWALFSGAILGTGILMGGAWAYEALSFGGYWAWDPVENMSLVPWIVLIAGIHTNLVARSTGYSIRSTYVFYLLTFLLIVYSTFLTRSGVLGDTSVHAFTEMGLEWQLIIFIFGYLGLSVLLLARQYKKIPAPEKEESIGSKEFWMFIGTLVLLFSALIITASTSLPVYNKIVQFFDPTFEGRVITDPEPHYNKYQLWIGVFIGLLSGIAQYLRFREGNWKNHARKFYTHAGIAFATTLGLTILISFWIEINAWQYWLLAFCGIFAVVCNLDYLITFVKGNLKLAGSAFAHIGFGLMIVGILASGLNQRVISKNPFVMDGLIEGADDESLANNILLFKNSPMFMNGYEVTYLDDTLDVFTRTYQVNYKKRNEQGEIVEEFDLYPNILYDKTFSKVAASNPATKRYLNKDIFTHIASLPQVEMDMEFRQQQEDSLKYRLVTLSESGMAKVADTIPAEGNTPARIQHFQLQLEQIVRHAKHPDYHPEEGDLAIGAELLIKGPGEDSIYRVTPVIVLRGQLLYNYPVQINEISTKVRLNQDIFEQVFAAEEELSYQEFTLKQGEQIQHAGTTIAFRGFNKEPKHPAYVQQEGDIAVSALIEAINADGGPYSAEPVYFIRGNQPFNLKDEIPELGFHFRFTGIDPATESISLMIGSRAGAPEGPKNYSVELATNSLRSDYIVLEAIMFPGINFFWLGSLLMMIGLGFSMFIRIRSRKNS